MIKFSNLSTLHHTYKVRQNRDIVVKRRKMLSPSQQAQLRVEWIQWLVGKYGSNKVGKWIEPPVSFEQWKIQRQAYKV